MVPHVHEHSVQAARGVLLAGIAALVVAVTGAIFVLWLMFASVKATPFDADGVRCYDRALVGTCLKTAEPPR